MIFEKGDRNWTAYVPNLPGRVATAKTLQEAEDAMREAIEFHLEGQRLSNMPIPDAVSTAANIKVSA